MLLRSCNNYIYSLCTLLSLSSSKLLINSKARLLCFVSGFPHKCELVVAHPRIFRARILRLRTFPPPPTRGIRKSGERYRSSDVSRPIGRLKPSCSCNVTSTRDWNSGGRSYDLARCLYFVSESFDLTGLRYVHFMSHFKSSGAFYFKSSTMHKRCNRRDQSKRGKLYTHNFIHMYAAKLRYHPLKMITAMPASFLMITLRTDRRY